MITDDFGHWLAGFIDGEGCFSIVASRRGNGSVQYVARLMVVVRGDDTSILHEIHQKTGIGRLHAHRTGGLRVDGRPHHPGIAWAVQSKKDCLALVAILDRYPLRAKKRNDYLIWREAVLLWSRIRRRGNRYVHDWSEIATLAETLKSERAFTFETASGQGFSEAVVSITRDLRADYHDLSLFN